MSTPFLNSSRLSLVISAPLG